MAVQFSEEDKKKIEQDKSEIYTKRTEGKADILQIITLNLLLVQLL